MSMSLSRPVGDPEPKPESMSLSMSTSGSAVDPHSKSCFMSKSMSGSMGDHRKLPECIPDYLPEFQSNPEEYYWYEDEFVERDNFWYEPEFLPKAKPKTLIERKTKAVTCKELCNEPNDYHSCCVVLCFSCLAIFICLSFNFGWDSCSCY